MLDFHKYFTNKNAIDNNNDGEFFTIMVETIITENAQRNNENVEDVLRQLAAKETENFREFKLAIEQQIKMLLFVNIRKLLRQWEVKNTIKINAFERKEKYTHQNVPDREFKTCYSIFHKNNDYFNGNYNSATITKLSQKLQELKDIYKALNNKENDFLQTEYLLELLIAFQECTSNTNQATKNLINQLITANQLENKEWEIIKDQEISIVKSNDAMIEIELHDQLNNKIIAKSKISKFRNFIIKIFTFGKINKHQQIAKEIANIKKQLQDNAKNKEDDIKKAIKQVISESNQITTSNNAIKNEQPVVTKQLLTL